MNGAEWLATERERLNTVLDQMDPSVFADIPPDWICGMSLPKRKYKVIETPVEYLVFYEDDHGTFS